MDARPNRAQFPAQPNTLYTSDQHHGHIRICDLCGRPYNSVEEMDESLIVNWNAVVRPHDIVWMLGDYGMGNIAKCLGYLPRLNGRKRLVAGNHDTCWAGHRDGHKHVQTYLDAGFELVTPWARTRLAGRDVMLSHFPYSGDHSTTDRFADYRLRDAGKWLIHGHVHDAWKVNGRQINVGVDVWDYTPVHASALEEIILAAEHGPDYAKALIS